MGKIGKGYRYEEIQIATYHDGTPRMGRKPILDPEMAPLIVKAFEMKARGAPYKVISQQTGLYGLHSGAWNHFFANRIYIGEYEFRGEVFTNIYPALISRELFEAVQRQLPKREHKMKGRHHPRRKGSSYFLGNIAVCAFCGGRMEGKSVGKYRYYVCSQHNQRVDLCPNANLVPANAVEEEVLRVLIEYVLQLDYLKQLLQWTNECLNSGLEELKLRVERTQRDFAEASRRAEEMALNFGLMDSPSRTAERLLMEQDARVEVLRSELFELETALVDSRIEVGPDVISNFIKRTTMLIHSGEFFDLREVCEQLSSCIVMSCEECRIELHFPTL